MVRSCQLCRCLSLWFQSTHCTVNTRHSLSTDSDHNHSELNTIFSDSNTNHTGWSSFHIDMNNNHTVVDSPPPPPPPPGPHNDSNDKRFAMDCLYNDISNKYIDVGFSVSNTNSEHNDWDSIYININIGLEY